MSFRAFVLAVVATAACFTACFAALPDAGASHIAWSTEDLAIISSLRLDASESFADPSNVFEGSAEAVALGRALFHDPGFSADGKVACATCHIAESQFGDELPRGHGIGIGQRRTMPIMGARASPFLLWDGRKDSLWSQALGPLEDALEQGGNRVGIARRMASHYRGEYEKIFGTLPDLGSMPAAASPVGSPGEQAAWTRMTETDHVQVNRVYANMGKALAAFERTIVHGESRFDRYADAVASGDAAGQKLFSLQEERGLKIFITRGQCTTCHNGPLLSDHAFHNTGVPPVAGVPDSGRFDGARKLMGDEFNCMGPYSDARPEQCAEIQYLATGDSRQIGAFRTPGLRNVALRPPYMHAGQLGTLEQVIRHYMRAPSAVAGHSEISAGGMRDEERIVVRLKEADVADLVAFLATLTGPVIQKGQ